MKISKALSIIIKKNILQMVVMLLTISVKVGSQMKYGIQQMRNPVITRISFRAVRGSSSAGTSPVLDTDRLSSLTLIFSECHYPMGFLWRRKATK